MTNAKYPRFIPKEAFIGKWCVFDTESMRQLTAYAFTREEAKALAKRENQFTYAE